MKDLNLILGLGLALALTGCPGDDSGDEGAGSGDSSGGNTTTTGMDSTGDPPGDTTTDDPGTTTDDPGTTTDDPGTTTDDPGTTTDDPGTTSGGMALSFGMDVFPIIEAGCLGAPGTCHGGGAAGFGFSAGDPGSALSSLVDVPSSQSPLDRVEPGSSADSYLFHKVNGTHNDVGGSGQRMPRGAPPLDGADIDTIAQWIDDGAMP